MLQEEFKERLKKKIGDYNYHLSELYPKEFLHFLSKKSDGDETQYSYRVEDRYTYMYYVTNLKTNADGKLFFSCDCRKFRREQSCEHVGACILQNITLFVPKSREDIETISKKILDYYNPSKEERIIKEEVQLDLTLKIYKRYYNQLIELSLKIGIDKKYTLNESKIKKFLSSYHYGDEKVVFGKEFTYDYEKNYFKNENKRLLDFLFERIQRGYNYSVLIFEEKEFPMLLEILENNNFSIEEFGKFNGIEKECPFQFQLTKENEKFNLKVLNINEYHPITSNGSFAIVNQKIYKIAPSYQNLAQLLFHEQIDHLVFSEKEFETFSKGLLPIIKNEIQIDDKIKDIIVTAPPQTKIYFDLFKNLIKVNIKFLYQEYEIDYFDEGKSNILRDFDYEKEVYNDMIKFGFQEEKKQILMEDVETIGNFLENDLSTLSEKYEIFTSKKFQEMKILKNNRIVSTFSIGKDNILNYNFDLGEIEEKDLSKLLTDLKSKKKYYRLKNGNLINLEDQKLVEFQQFLEDMELDETNFNGQIPKYKALYLSSLKNQKYSFVTTDDLFEKFIDKFNSYRDVDLKFTKKEQEVLRDYQMIGVKWLYQIHKCDFGGILADEMGLGKSIQVMYFIKKLLEEDNQSKFLIVAPTSLIYNWDREFKKFNLNLSYQVISGSKKARNLLLQNSQSIYITSYGLLREDFELYQDKSFKVCILDEAQNIKNPLAEITKCVKKINAETKIALTGTPVENSSIELWSIFDFVMPGFLSSQQKFSQKYKVRSFDENENYRLEQLNHQISPFLLRRKKKDVINDLPDKIENNIYIDLSEKQKKLYMNAVKEAEKQMDLLIQKDGFQKSKFVILQLLTKLRQLCIDPRILYSNYMERSSKIDNLIKIIKEVNEHGHKVLLFTSFKMALDLVEQEFQEEGISSYRIDGSVSSKKRIELVEKFNHDDTNVFLIMLKSGGTGLNLTSADIVIHLDLWWNPQAENQATDRAHRIGQKNVVEVIKLVTKGTIEEKILELQEKKKILSEKLLEGSEKDQNIISTLSEKDIRDLLSYENKEE